MNESLLTDIDSPASIPSGTVTFLFTDIQGSTQLLERLREQYALVLAEQRDLLRAIFAEYNGHEIDTQGDAFFVAFPRALDAVNCAIQAQRALAAHTWPQNVRVYVRMGLHTGEPIIARTGYVGMDVHLAARIGAAGHGGQILLSKTTRELVYADLPHGVSLRDLGEHKLKDIRHPQKIYQVEIEGLNVEFPSLKTLATGEEPPTPGNPPFKGMQFFDEADADLFFGREVMTSQLIERIQTQRFLAIIGASGSGKSSIVRAGVVPLLKRQQAAHWHIHVITPTSHPLEALAASLTHGTESVTATTTLIDDLAHDQRSLHLYVRKNNPTSRLLIVVDQFEELFTLCRNEAERQAFVDNLLYAHSADGCATTIVIVLRADFYEHLAQYAALREAVAKHQEYLGPMSVEELREAIEEPARRGGWEFSPGLVDLMLHDVGATPDHQPEPGALPLLSHALLETWRRRRGNVMTLKGYSESGGVRGAIARTAETVFYTELNAEQRLIARSIFLRLTELGEGTQDTRRRATLEELFPPASFAAPAQVEEVVVILADARLITTGEGTIEVAHEALIREWSTLREWLTQNRDGLRMHRHLTEAAQEWELLEHDASVLYRGTRLAQAVEWAEANPRELNAQEQNFLDVSKESAIHEEAEREAQRKRELEAAQKLAETEKRRAEEQTQSASRLRRRAVYLSASLIVAAALAVVALIFGQQSNNNAQQAQVHLAGAQTAEANAVAQRQEADKQKQEALRQASIGLASQAIAELQGTAPERGVLLALEALQNYPYTGQAESALAQAVEEGKSYVDLATDYNQSPSSGVVWSPDGKRLAGGHGDRWGLIITWDVAANRELDRLSGTVGTDRDCGVLDMAWSPDSDRLAVVPSNFGLDIVCAEPAVWDLKTHTKVLTLTSPLSTTTSVDWSHDGRFILTSHVDGTARIWDAKQGSPLRVLSGHTAVVQDAAWSPTDDRIVTASQDRTAKVWDVKTGREILTLTGHANSVIAVSWSPDGKYVATASADGTGRVWDADRGEVIFTLTGHTASLLDIDWSSDGEMIATSGLDNTSRIWDASNGALLFELRGQNNSYATLAWSPIDRHLVIMGGVRPRLWNLTDKSLRLPTVNDPVIMWTMEARWSPDGTYIATVSMDSTARIFDAATGKQLLVLKHPFFVTFFDWSPDSQSIVTTDGLGSSRIWNVRTGKLLLEHQGPSGNIAFAPGWSPDGSRIATSYTPTNTLEMWDAKTGATLFTIGDGTYLMHRSSWSPQGDRFATGCWYSPVDDNLPARIWDGQTGQLLMTLDSHDGESIRAVWSPDGKRLVVTYEKGPVKIWDAVTGQELVTFGGHTTFVWDAAWSPDGKRIASADQAGNVKVWDATTGQEVMSFKEPGEIRSIQWSADGHDLLMAGSFITPFIRRVWQSTDELVQYAKQCCVLRELTAAERQQFGLAPK